MADSTALRTIEEVTTTFLLSYKKSTDDYVIYLQHACDAVRDFNLYNGNQVTVLKMTVTTDKWLNMPTDMIGFNDLCVPYSGEWWSLTEHKPIVNTTTFTGATEGRDSDAGEGVDIRHPLSYGYGAKGGVNAYNYTIDWKGRRIYLEGIDSGTVVLFYVTSGISISGDTYISELIVPVINAYLLWKESYWIRDLIRERDMRERDYTKEVLKARNFINSMSFNQLRDIWLGTATQSVRR